MSQSWYANSAPAPHADRDERVHDEDCDDRSEHLDLRLLDEERDAPGQPVSRNDGREAERPVTERTEDREKERPDHREAERRRKTERDPTIAGDEGTFLLAVRELERGQGRERGDSENQRLRSDDQLQDEDEGEGHSAWCARLRQQRGEKQENDWDEDEAGLDGRHDPGDDEKLGAEQEQPVRPEQVRAEVVEPDPRERDEQHVVGGDETPAAVVEDGEADDASHDVEHQAVREHEVPPRKCPVANELGRGDRLPLLVRVERPELTRESRHEDEERDRRGDEEHCRALDPLNRGAALSPAQRDDEHDEHGQCGSQGEPGREPWVAVSLTRRGDLDLGGPREKPQARDQERRRERVECADDCEAITLARLRDDPPGEGDACCVGDARCDHDPPPATKRDRDSRPAMTPTKALSRASRPMSSSRRGSESLDALDGRRQRPPRPEPADEQPRQPRVQRDRENGEHDDEQSVVPEVPVDVEVREGRVPDDVRPHVEPGGTHDVEDEGETDGRGGRGEESDGGAPHLRRERIAGLDAVPRRRSASRAVTAAG